MDIFLSKVTQQAMNYAIRSGVTITASYAIRQSARLLKNVEGRDREQLMALQNKLQSKIRILSPAIDMIDLISARGNTSLESAVSLTKSLRFEIQSLGQRLERAAVAEEKARRNTKAKIQNDVEIKSIIDDIRQLLSKIEDAVPMINLAITTSGASLSTKLPSTVSPSRLLQASTFLTAGDTQYSITPDQAVQVGPTFILSVYMLFAGHIRPQDEDGIRETTWKEVMHKARVKLRRIPMGKALGSTERTQSVVDDSADASFAADARADEFAYQLLLIEDLDDDRVHTFEDSEVQPGSYDDVEISGIREIVPIHQVSKIFYADTGKVLNIGSDGETNNPVLLLKRDLDAVPPRRMMKTDDLDLEQNENITHGGESNGSGMRQETETKGPWALPMGLDPEWLAFEVFTEVEDSEDEDSEAETSPARPKQPSRSTSLDPQLAESLADLHLQTKSSSNSPSMEKANQVLPHSSSADLATRPTPWANGIRTSLSLMELLLRLTSLQQFQQQSHLSITDELLNFFLEESASTGAGGDEEYRQRLRADARRRVGWDPYNESPMKRRGESYQQENGSNPRSPQWDTNNSYEDQDLEPYYLRYGSATPASPSPSLRPARPPLVQTRSMTRMSSSPIPSPGSQNKRRQSLLRNQTEERRGSPLRPQTAMTDEGLGTSPASEVQKE